MEEIRICNYISGEETEIIDLVKTSFNEFVSVDCTEEGIKIFNNFIEPEVFKKRNQSDTFTLTAKTKEGLIVGMIEVRNDGHVCLLFVSKNFQRKGISKKLFNKAKDICIKKTDEQVIMSVNSSIYAINIYKKLEFTAIGDKKIVNGINFVEMINLAN